MSRLHLVLHIFLSWLLFFQHVISVKNTLAPQNTTLRPSSIAASNPTAQPNEGPDSIPDISTASLSNALNSGGYGQKKENISFATFLASLSTALIIFGIELFAFFLLKNRFARIYAPKTFLVPRRERISVAPHGLLRWLIPVLRTPNSEFIHKCGLDAYLFLRYLRMLIKIFLPLACVIIPILLPINKIGTGNGSTSGMDTFGWQNMSPNVSTRFWAHLALACLAIVYVCYVFYDELRKYVRLRQAYLTSPQHRLRASATTVLVSNIPQRWMNIDALGALFDVYPGGVRNIWINRNYDELNEKVEKREKIARIFEEAETRLLKKCLAKNSKMQRTCGHKTDKNQLINPHDHTLSNHDEMGAGVDIGNPNECMPSHQVDNTLKKLTLPVPVLGKGLDALGSRMEKAGRGIGKVGDVVGEGLKKAKHDVHGRFQHIDESVFDQDTMSPVAGSDILYSAAVLPSVSLEICESARSGVRPQVRTSICEESFAKNLEPCTCDAEFPQEPQNGEGNTSRGSGSHTISPTNIAKSEHQPKCRKNSTSDSMAADLANDEDAMWRKFISSSERETMRLPLIDKPWFPSLPFIGKKVDTIYYCRKKLSELNIEIENDQANYEKFPNMSSAFIQFNHQVAAHMACQSLTHHIPKTMTPRMIEISPTDVIWENLSIRWWERMIRTGLVFIIISGVIIAWAFPMTFTGLLSQISYLTGVFHWLSWIEKLPDSIIATIQGALPPLFLAILLAVLPIFLRWLSHLQGGATEMSVELTVQNYYFAFLFIQVFLVVSIASGIGATVKNLVNNPLSVPQTLADNLPKASNYFFSYMILQALTVSAGALMQFGALLQFFLLAPLMDSTPRDKWKRQTCLPKVNWGTFYPVYTNLAAIGLIYSVISPLILVFNIITFSLFWVVYRYQTLYVLRFQNDTGGLLFPRAINQLFTGLYVMELCLIGLFFLVRDAQNRPACTPQAAIMIAFLIMTVIYQYTLNSSFGRLFRYIPITLEGDAVRRDEEFRRAHRKTWMLEEEAAEWDERNKPDSMGTCGVPRHTGTTQDITIESWEKDEYDEKDRQREHIVSLGGVSVVEATQGGGSSCTVVRGVLEKDERETGGTRFRHAFERKIGRRVHTSFVSNSSVTGERKKSLKQAESGLRKCINRLTQYGEDSVDVESQVTGEPTQRAKQELVAREQECDDTESWVIGDMIYRDFDTALEDMTISERDSLVNYAFQHRALRATRPSVWIPRDALGISDDEIARTQLLTRGTVWMSNKGARIDNLGYVKFGRAPADLSPMELVRL